MEGEVEIKLCSPVKQRRNSTSNTTPSANSSKNNSLDETDSVDVNEEHVWIFDSR